MNACEPSGSNQAACHVCKLELSRRSDVRRHLAKQHGLTYPQVSRGRPSKSVLGSASTEMAQSGPQYRCAVCPELMRGMNALVQHMNQHDKHENAIDDDATQVLDGSETETTIKTNDASFESLQPSAPLETAQFFQNDKIDLQDIVTIPSDVPIPNLMPAIPDLPMAPSRSRRDAILLACNQQHEPPTVATRTIGIVDALELEPVAIVTAAGVEENVLAHATVACRCALPSSQPVEIKAVPSKRKLDGADGGSLLCNRCLTYKDTLDDAFRALLSVSPYTHLLQRRRFSLLTDQLCDLLNQDLDFHPHMKYFAAQLLAGCILLRIDTGEAIMVNTVEVYARKKTVDVHREPFGTRKQVTMATSLPPPIKLPHAQVWPTTLASPDGQKLVIGTLSLDALISSCIRLDPTINTQPSVGAITSIFTLKTLKESLATRVYVDQESIERALKLASNPTASSCASTDITSQLRQLKTKFHAPTTYHLCRASGPITLAHQLQESPLCLVALSKLSHIA
ncbi:hypothetical protein BC940DRAFT_311159 [Gongronella butleri]|nr:hypothetical protein BC940DRAFT_311159 [Gongronella butleri]